jgi:hypothetical protein
MVGSLYENSPKFLPASLQKQETRFPQLFSPSLWRQRSESAAGRWISRFPPLLR